MLALSLATRADAQRPGASGDTLASVDSTIPSRGAKSAGADSVVRYRPETFSHFAMRTFGPLPLLRATAMAGFDQWQRQPDHWSQTSRGFRDRLDSRLGGDALSHTIRFGVARMAHEETSKYRRCECSGFSARLQHALVTPLRVETPRGDHLSAITPLGEIASALVVTSVHPGGFSVKRGLSGGAGGLASASLMAAVREFWPWHWRPPGL